LKASVRKATTWNRILRLIALIGERHGHDDEDEDDLDGGHPCKWYPGAKCAPDRKLAPLFYV